MKKLIIIFIFVIFFGQPSFADDITVNNGKITEKSGEITENKDEITTNDGEITVNDDELTINDGDGNFNYEADSFIPPAVSDKLSESGVALDDSKMSQSIWSFLLGALKTSFSGYSTKITALLGVIVISSVVYRFIDNKCFKTIFSYIMVLVMLINVFGITNTVIASVTKTLSSVSDILSAVLPAFTAVLLMGGSTFSSIASSASFGAVITLLQIVTNTLLVPCISLLTLMVMFERLSPQFSEINLVKFLRKSILTVISFITTVMLTVISYQQLISSGKDQMSLRTVRFAASNFIPIVGSAVGESFKTVSAGLKYLKNTVGGAVALSIFVTVMPILVQIFLVKLFFNFLSISSGFMGCKNESALFEASASILDVLNAIIICISILSLLLIITFVIASFAVGT